MEIITSGLQSSNYAEDSNVQRILTQIETFANLYQDQGSRPNPKGHEKLNERIREWESHGWHVQQVIPVQERWGDSVCSSGITVVFQMEVPQEGTGQRTHAA